MLNYIGSQSTNETRVYTLTLTDPDGGNYVGRFGGGDVLSAVLWAGQDGVPWPLTAAWVDSFAGTFRLTVPKGVATGVGTGQYRVQVVVNQGTADVPGYEGWVKLTDAPGLGVIGKTYCSMADMLKVCPWISGVASAENNQAGYGPQRADAADWLDDCIQRARRPGQVAQYTLSPWQLTPWRTGMRDVWLQSLLDATPTKLMLTGPSGRKLVRANAAYACYLVLAPMLGDKQGVSYRALGGRFFALADTLISDTTAEFDVNGDGIPDLTVDLGAVDVIRG